MEKKEVVLIIILVMLALSIGFSLYYIFRPQKEVVEAPQSIEEPDEGEIEEMDEEKETNDEEPESDNLVDILIFVSPQYANDTGILQAVTNYLKAVKQDIGWNAKIINLKIPQNDFREIDKIIEDYYISSEKRLKACIMVGEDIDTPLDVEYYNKEVPSPLPWSTLESYIVLRKNDQMSCIDDSCEIQDKDTGEIIEKFNKKEGRILKLGAVLNEPKRVDIVISFLYPTHSLDYQVKSQQIQSVFEKFSKDRNKIYPRKSVMFVDKIGENIKKGEEILKNYTDNYYKENPHCDEVKDTLDNAYMLYWATGHGSPDIVQLTPPPNTCNFSARFLYSSDYSLNTPLFFAGGCHTGGWWTSSSEDNDKLDLSINENRDWFGSKIFLNPFLRVAILGVPTQVNQELQSFLEVNLPDLMEGKTLAESLVGKTLKISNMVIYGDPTFHYRK